MNHHSHLEDPFLHCFVHHRYRVPAAVGSVPAAVRGTLKAVGVLEHRYILCQHNAYLVAVAVATLAAILDSRNYQEGVLHSLAGVALPVADSYGCPVGYFGIRRQSRVEPG
jgi:hypothetical protein